MDEGLCDNPDDARPTQRGIAWRSSESNLRLSFTTKHVLQAPKTVYNWIMLAKEGKYDNVIFHRLIPGFMVREQRPGTHRLGG